MLQLVELTMQEAMTLQLVEVMMLVVEMLVAV